MTGRRRTGRYSRTLRTRRGQRPSRTWAGRRPLSHCATGGVALTRLWWASARTALVVEGRKFTRSPVARIATVAGFALVAVTTIGGFAAAGSSGETVLGRKATALVTASAWAGYTGLGAMSVGVTMLLGAGVVMAWVVGREFTDGTVVGLFAIPPRLTTIADAKMTVALAWVALLALAEAAVLAIGGVALGLPLNGAPACAAVVWLTAVLLGASALPVMWVATRWRGYLAGIAAALGLVVVTNVAAGFGLGSYLPWAVPVLWATPGTGIPAAMLALPVAAALLGGLATRRAWRDLHLGD